MKRLKYFLHQMEDNTTTYKEMYEGRMYVEGNVEYDNSHYLADSDIMFTIEQTGDLTKDKPALVYHIPTERLGFEAHTNAAADFCLRAFIPYIEALNSELYNRKRPDSENGKYYLPTPGGEVLMRNSAYFSICCQKDYENGAGDAAFLLSDGKERPPRPCLCLRILVQLPRKKLRKAIQMLCHDLPDAVEKFIAEFDVRKLEEALKLAEKQKAIRNYLRESQYCAFIANGSILPRSKGTDLPMKDAIPFRSTPEDEIEICGVRGMGIRRGVTVITGGGYSGKSTLLDAISAGIYDHIKGDGRELCVTDESAVTVSAEDGRSIKRVNISPFIKWLPGGDTSDFSTDRASGSTSQAANIMEAVDFGSRLLLIDEDRSATNFMIRDKMMKELIEKEPITPFTDRVNELYKALGVSIVLVIGGSGEYLSVADRIYMMEDYLIHDVTAHAKDICVRYGVTSTPPVYAVWKQHRVLLSDYFTSYPEGSGSERLEVSDMGLIVIGDEKIDTRGLHDIISSRQLTAIGFMLRYLEISDAEHEIDIYARVDELYRKIEAEGLDFVHSTYFTSCERFLDLPRKAELLAAVSRMRMIEFKLQKKF